MGRNLANLGLILTYTNHSSSLNISISSQRYWKLLITLNRRPIDFRRSGPKVRVTMGNIFNRCYLSQYHFRYLTV